ncbi:hypothetical protein AXF42_Ash019980 [Apostasia shenzhenica]|uniref:Uncharacterized protein n=1 Tax=Apostasia shenzhenica TaxID=1088818 RepID=A0A2I0AZM2_9ASPA|nr:hypothetical protein AXF42_Ash019980 [Apostasia shenzhenica]
MAHVSDIKLIRTDTTLDLSQKAEKGMLCTPKTAPFIGEFCGAILLASDVGLKDRNTLLHNSI